MLIAVVLYLDLTYSLFLHLVEPFSILGGVKHNGVKFFVKALFPSCIFTKVSSHFCVIMHTIQVRASRMCYFHFGNGVRNGAISFGGHSTTT